MSASEWLPVVLALPLAGTAILVAAGRAVPDRVAGWLATGVVGLAFALSIGLGLDYASRAGVGEAAAVTVPLWRWIAAGDDLVEVTAAVTDLDRAAEIPASAVGRLWAPLDRPGVRAVVGDLWDPAAVVGLRPMAGDVPAFTPLTHYNVSPGPDGFTAATPRTQRGFVADVALQLDGLSLTMLLVVTGVGFLIHLFAIGYMTGDPGMRRFFAYLNLFVFSMFVLVLGADFLVLFVGWELVGLCSYLLIGFWYADAANAAAGRKAFIVNRVGDFAFLLGLMLLWSTFGSLAFADVLPAARTHLAADSTLAVAIAALLLVGATGKSAQVPLYVWLPDAMAGPTPVSALIHAATMVTAGVYMIARAHVLFEQASVVMTAVAVVGALTAGLGACIAVVQVDVKRLLAYSTVSQLGYMFLAVGAGAYTAGVFHLVTHAFFKALLFLGAGSLMHAMERGFRGAHDHPEPRDAVPPEQDLRRMGGLLRRAPVTGWTFVVGGLALAGVFPLAGFWSKDEVLLEVLARPGATWTALYVVGLLTAGLTAFYSGRLLLLALTGEPRSEGAGAATESGPVMTWPLVALAALTLVGGVVGVGGARAPLVALLDPVVGGHGGEAGPSKLVAALVATAAALAGLALAVAAYGPRPALDPARVGRVVGGLHRLAWRGFYVDELYDRFFVRPFRAAADWLWRVVDDRLVDGAVNAVGRAALALACASRRLQTGYVRSYVLALLLGAVALAAYFVLGPR